MVNAHLILGRGDVFFVDAGLPGSELRIAKALDRSGPSLKDFSYIVAVLRQGFQGTAESRMGEFKKLESGHPRKLRRHPFKKIQTVRLGRKQGGQVVGLTGLSQAIRFRFFIVSNYSGKTTRELCELLLLNIGFISSCLTNIREDV